MGLKRFLWRRTGIGKIIDTVNNIVNEGDVVSGIKKTVKETYCEDNPITSIIYKSGQYDGKRKGFLEASCEYEKKLLEQAQFFLDQKKIYENQRDNYETLLDEYEKEIDTLTKKVNRTEEENIYLQKLLLKDRQLRQMKD
ncbi:MAG: hypothetical protein PWQ76_298 [Clostridiales bacterium]|jgi:hypothetical protein|nr:hypothetical protein [Oscillospiraceae bacterium]MDN5378045.1 hypothetical protein [Clostridiales bacterium]